MRKTEQTPEPSIEEILASIRKIIADDGVPATGPAFDPYATGGDGDQDYYTDPADDSAAAHVNGKPLTIAQPIGAGGAADGIVRRTTGKAARDDEILELTEDFMLEELNGFDDPQPVSATAEMIGAAPSAPVLADISAANTKPAPALAAFPGTAAATAAPVEVLDESADAGLPPLPTDEELAEFNSVLSSVVAEMQRITEVKGFEPPADFLSAMPAPKTAAPTPTAPVAASPATPTPAPATPAPAAPKAPAAPAQKPVWSARHQSEAAKTRSTGSAETSAARAEAASAPAPATTKPATAVAPSAPVNGSQHTAPSPLMEAIATSLVTALADSNEEYEKRAAASLAEEPLPEDAFAPDMDDIALSAGIETPAAPADKSASTSPLAAALETPVAPKINGAQQPAPLSSPTAGSAPAKPVAAPAVRMNGTHTALPAGLEDGVKDMLQPVLAAWLSENLPRIVEKILRDELAARGPLGLRDGKSGDGRD